MTTPYLNRPLLPLAVALPLLLENIEAELADEKLEAVDEQRLCRRAKLIRSLLGLSGRRPASLPTGRSGRAWSES